MKEDAMQEARAQGHGDSDLASLRVARSDSWERNDASPPRPRRSSSWRAVLVVLVALAAIAGAATLAAPRLWTLAFHPEVTTAEIAMVAPSHGESTLTSAGYVVAQRSSRVGVELLGKVKRVIVKEGDVVQQGHVLAILDDGYSRAALEAARAHVAVTAARAETAQAQLAETAQQVERDRGLVRDRAIPAAELADLEARKESLSRAALAAQVETRAALADLRPLTTLISEHTIVAPISGVVSARPLEAGEVAMPGGKPVVEIFDPASMMVETDVPEARLELVKPGTPCEIVLDAFPQDSFRGQVAEIGHKVDRAKATITVKVRFLDRPEAILPDMAARTSFLSRPLSDEEKVAPPMKVVAASAVVERAGKKVVFVLDGDRARMVEVTVGPLHGSSVEILSGPASGSTVITTPPPSLEDDQKVTVRQ